MYAHTVGYSYTEIGKCHCFLARRQHTPLCLFPLCESFDRGGAGVLEVVQRCTRKRPQRGDQPNLYGLSPRTFLFFELLDLASAHIVEQFIPNLYCLTLGTCKLFCQPLFKGQKWSFILKAFHVTANLSRMRLSC